MVSEKKHVKDRGRSIRVGNVRGFGVLGLVAEFAWEGKWGLGKR